MVMTMVDKSIYDLYGHLLVSANSVRGNAYAKYSGFRVGAALMADDGTVHTGVNVENASYGCGVCAEAGAISSMIGSRGVRGIVAICVSAEGDVPVTPCGNCRQKIAEFADSGTIVISGNPKGEMLAVYEMSELLPHSFSDRNLERE